MDKRLMVAGMAYILDLGATLHPTLQHRYLRFSVVELLTSRQYLRQIILTLSPPGKNSESTDLSRITVIHPNR